MAYTPEQKAKWRQRPDVQAKARQHKRDWNQANRERVNKYMRDYYRARVDGGSTTPTKQSDLFDGGTN